VNPRTERRRIAGPAGALECAIDRPAGTAQGLALVCHPHPLHGGTMDNKVVQTIARAALALGYTAVRFNTRGTGGSEGAWDAGVGEVDDALAVLAAVRGEDAPAAARSEEAPATARGVDALPTLPLLLAGFSFGGAIAARAAQRLADAGTPADRLVLVAPAVVNFPLPAVRADTLLVHGETDDVVPLSAVLDWARPQALPLVLVPGAGHFFHGQLPLLKHIVTQALAPCAPLAST
jgi:alpha/beta superfamily hydrolase